MTRHMAGSLLPSQSSRTLAPVTVGDWEFKIIPAPDLQTYVLTANGSNLASHPNSYSLRELVDRIAAHHNGKTTANRVHEQWDYILACGGMTRSNTALDYYLGRLPQ